MNKKHVIYVWGCLLAAALFGGCRAPEVDLHNVDIVEMSFRKIDLQLEFKVRNPNWCALPLSDLKYTFQTQGKAFAKGKLPPPVPIVGGGETITLFAPLDLHSKEFMPIIRKCWSGKEADYKIKILATFSALGIPIPVTMTVKNSLPAIQLPKWSLKGSTLQKGGSPMLTLIFELTNPNKHALSIASVSGKLKSGEHVVMEIFQPVVAKIPGGKKVRIEVPIRVQAMGLLMALGKALSTGELLRFEGDFKLKKPLELR